MNDDIHHQDKLKRDERRPSSYCIDSRRKTRRSLTERDIDDAPPEYLHIIHPADSDVLGRGADLSSASHFSLSEEAFLQTVDSSGAVDQTAFLKSQSEDTIYLFGSSELEGLIADYVLCSIADDGSAKLRCHVSNGRGEVYGKCRDQEDGVLNLGMRYGKLGCTVSELFVEYGEAP